MKCITVLYPSKDNYAFDHEFYKRPHAPLIRDILGKSLHKIEVRKGGAAQDANAWDSLGRVGSITSFGVDSAGELYVVTGEGLVARIVPGGQ